MRTQKSRLTPAQVERDRAALAVLNAPNNRAKILGLIAAGHSIAHVVGVGEYHGSWTETEVWQTLRSVGVHPAKGNPFGGAKPAPDAPTVELSEAQWDVLQELCKGATLDQVASRLFLSKATVHRHNAAIVEAFDASDRAHVLALVLTGKIRPVQSAVLTSVVTKRRVSG